MYMYNIQGKMCKLIYIHVYSPDLNPIENVWGSMKEYLRNTYKPKGLEDLKKGIREFWKTLTPSVCTKYINHIHTVMPTVIERSGGPSGF